MKKVSVGIVGCGKISGIYCEAGRTFSNIDVVACADLDLERAVAVATEFGIPEAMEVQDLMAHSGIQVVVNLTIPAAHAEVTLKALKKDKHVYSEKPLALRRREARELIGLARERTLRLGCAPDTFLGAGLQTCRKLIDEGAIGVPVGGAAFMLQRGPERWHPNPGFFYQKGAGPLFDMGPYYLTALTALLGPIRRVTGSVRASFKQREIFSEPLKGSLIDVDVPTHCAAILDFESGPIVSLMTSFDVCHSETPRIEIYGSEATLSVPDPNTFGGPVRIRELGADEWREVPLAFGYAGNSRGVGVADLAASIESGSDHRANDRLAYHVLDVMHGVLDSAESGRHVDMKSTMVRPQPLPQGLAEGEIDE